MRHADSKTIDDLRVAYHGLGWLQWFFPERIAAALITEELPSIEKTPGRSTPYSPVQARNILTAFTETNWLSKLLFRCLRAFKTSTLFRAYQENPAYLTAQDAHAEVTRDVTSHESTTDDSLSSSLLPVIDLDMMDEVPTVPQMPVGDTTGRIDSALENLLQMSVFTFLDVRDNVGFSSASKYFNCLFKPALQEEKLKKLVSKLLQHVVHGEQKEVEDMLKSEPALSLTLLLKKGEVKDYSDRTFHDASPLQCIFWTRDTRYMGQIILNYFLNNPLSEEIKRELDAQLQTMQAGGRDLVKMDRNPTSIPINELLAFVTGAPDPLSGVINPRSVRADNKDILIYHWDAASEEEQLYYYTEGMVTPFEYEPTDDNEVFLALFKFMEMNSAKKSNDAEHALIAKATGKTLSRNGIHYEQPAACKALVNLEGTANPCEIAFADIARLFATPDALLLWNNQFYYANKADSSVTLIAPRIDLTPKQIAYLRELKTSLSFMPIGAVRQPNTLEEHQLINTVFRDHPAFKSTHHCESYYDFGIIDALQTYVDRFNDLSLHQRATWWRRVVAKSQRLAPAHILQHYCDPDRPFYPLPDFKAATFKRESRFYTFGIREEGVLFSKSSFDLGFGFEFGLSRSIEGKKAARISGNGIGSEHWLEYDLIALRRLYEVRTADAKLLQDHLHQLLAPVPISSTSPGGPN